jgi:hypothetical protein
MRALPNRPSAPDEDDGPSRRIVLTPASSITIRPVKWLWEDRLPLGALSLLGGREGIGKSILAYQLAADLTTGSLPGVFHRQPKPVLVVATEDSWEQTIAPRLLAAGGNLDLALQVEVVTVAAWRDQIVLPLDVAALREKVLEVRPALMVLDPLMGRVSGKLDTHVDQEVRQALEPLVAMADETSMAVLGLVHVNKSTSVDPLTLVMASRAFTAVPRAVLFVAVDPDKSGVRVLGQPKNSLGRPDLPHLAFTIHEEHVADTNEGPVTTGKLRWLGETDRTIHSLLRDGLEARNGTGSGVTDAAGWLTDYLSIHKVVESQRAKADGVGVGHNRAALDRAREKIKATPMNYGFPRRTAWCQPGLDPDELTTRLAALKEEPQSSQSSQSSLPLGDGESSDDCSDRTSPRHLRGATTTTTATTGRPKKASPGGSK